MNARHLAERRALYAAVEASSDRHVRDPLPEARVVHSGRSTVSVCGDTLWVRNHRRRLWSIHDVSTAFGPWPARAAVVDDYGDLIEVAPC